MRRAERNQFIDELEDFLETCASAPERGEDGRLRVQLEGAIATARKTWTASPELIEELLKIAVNLVETTGGEGLDDLAEQVGEGGRLHETALKTIEHAAFLLFLHHEMRRETVTAPGFGAIAVAYLNRYPIPDNDYLRTMWGAILTLGRV